MNNVQKLHSDLVKKIKGAEEVMNYWILEIKKNTDEYVKKDMEVQASEDFSSALELEDEKAFLMKTIEECQFRYFSAACENNILKKQLSYISQ